MTNENLNLIRCGINTRRYRTKFILPIEHTRFYVEKLSSVLSIREYLSKTGKTYYLITGDLNHGDAHGIYSLGIIYDMGTDLHIVVEERFKRMGIAYNAMKVLLKYLTTKNRVINLTATTNSGIGLLNKLNYEQVKRFIPRT